MWTLKAPRILLLAMLLPWVADAWGQPAKGLNDLGVIAFETKRYDQALEHLEKARALAPENPAIRRNLVTVHRAMANDDAKAGDLEAAIAHLERAIAVDPEDPAPLAEAGTYRLRAGQLEAAVARLEAAVELAPLEAETRAMLGEAYYQQNRLADAHEQWGRALSIQPELEGLQEKYDKLARESAVEVDFNQYSAGHFQLSYAKALSEDTRATVFDILEEAYESIGAHLGGRYPPGVVQVVLYDGEQFREATDSAAHVGALYDGKIRAPITSTNGRYLSRRVLTARLTHEYTHVVLASHLGQALPWWLNEGLAEVFSRDMDQSRRRLLGRALRGGRGHALADLEASQLKTLEREALGIAYAQAHATAEHLWRTGKAEKLARFVGLIDGGTAPEEALRAVYDLDYAGLEAAVADEYQ